MRWTQSTPLFFALACLVAVAADAAEPVAFRHFTYRGDDSVFEEALPAGHYRNPIISGFHPDPSICRVGDDYYLVNSSFIYYPGLPLFHSKDLVNWTQLGNAIDRPEQLNYDDVAVSQGLYAPAITFHNGTFYIICTMVGSHLSTGWSVNFLITAKNPAGPWSKPTLLAFEGMDPALFFDDDGRSYIVNNGQPEGGPKYPGHCAIWLQEFDVGSIKVVGPRTMIVNGGDDLSKKPWYVEGPHLYKHQGAYYLFCAQGGTEYNHSEVVFRSAVIGGPYEAWKRNPILTQRDLPPTVSHAIVSAGHADITRGPDGNEWAVFLACRPYEKNLYITGRETFLLPVHWTDDQWPVILLPGQRVPAIVASPETASFSEATQSTLTGNFTWEDGFHVKTLGAEWIMLRQPHQAWWQLHDDTLWLTPGSDPLTLAQQPTFLARRVQHAHFTASTELVPSADAKVSAGIAVFQNESHFYFLGARGGSRPEIFLEEKNGAAPSRQLATAPLANVGSLHLQIEVNNAALFARYSSDGKGWQTFVSKADATILTTEVAGGFVGALVGLHARIEAHP